MVEPDCIAKDTLSCNCMNKNDFANTNVCGHQSCHYHRIANDSCMLVVCGNHEAQINRLGVARSGTVRGLQRLGQRFVLAENPAMSLASFQAPVFPEPRARLEDGPYMAFTRSQWAALRKTTPMTLNGAEVRMLKGINDALSLQEVAEIYLPLARLLNLYVDA